MLEQSGEENPSKEMWLGKIKTDVKTVKFTSYWALAANDPETFYRIIEYE
jgi:hypothetical protein